VDTTLQYNQNQTTDDVRHELTRDQDRVDANMTYRLPGSKGGQLGLHLWQDVDSSELGAYSIEGVALNNQLVLGKNASLSFNYDSHSESHSTLGSSVPRTVDYLQTEVIYEITPGSGLTMRGAWRRDLQLQDPEDSRLTGDEMVIDVSYTPDYKWRYYLHIDSDTEGLVSPRDEAYRDSDNVTAGVSFRF
jgi:hypothetical protein